MQNEVILYVGQDRSLFGFLEEELGRLGYRLRWEASAESALVEMKTKTFLRTVAQYSSAVGTLPSFSQWVQFRQRYWVMLFDADLSQSDALDDLRTIKASDGSIGVVVLCSKPSLLNVALSQQNGAEACLFKPLRKLDALLDVISAVFQKTECWWQSLECVVASAGQQPTRERFLDRDDERELTCMVASLDD